jgi:1-acyl-sn-glycerol-3-phosphate acyltransferase
MSRPPDSIWDEPEEKREVVIPLPRKSLIQRDPFEQSTDPDPLLERLETLRPGAAPPEQPAAPHPTTPDGTPLTRGPRRDPGGRLPRLSEVELPDRPGWMDRMLSEDEQRRLTALSHLVEGEVDYDRFGFSPDVARRAFPFFMALYRAYFRVRSQGHENIPAEGPALLVGNHGGLLPFDGAMAVIDVLLHTDPPRLLRAIVDRWAGTLPFVNVFYSRVGQVIGTRENMADLLDERQLLMVFPEGVEGIRKRVTQRYRLQSFHVGFVEHALRARAPIVPVAFIGSDDQAPILYDVKPLARALGLPTMPITPTFPWLGPLGLLPYPVRYRIVYGEPLRFHERFGPEAAEEARLVHYLTKQVRRTVQTLVDKSR